MQPKVHTYVENNVIKHDLKGKVLDVGSLDVNGSVKDLFQGSEYIGLDMRAGNNVDVVANGHAMPFEENTFDIATCLETFEHDDDPFQTAKEMYRVLKKGGYVIVTASGISFAKHDHPNDYWRFTREGLMVVMKDFKLIEAIEDEDEVYFFGIKD